MKYIIITVFAVLSLVLIGCSSSASRNEKIHEQLKAEVEMINKRSLEKISESIRFDSCVLLKNNNMENYYTYIDTITPNPSFFKNIEEEAKSVVKNNPGMAEIKSFGISTKYIYRDMEGKNMYTFDITSEDY